MDKRHHYVATQDLCSGMTLADDLLDKAGHVLLPEGTVLTEKMLQSLPHHGVHRVSIHNSQTAMDDGSEVLFQDQKTETDSSQLNQQLERLSHLFRKSLPDTPNRLLLAYLQTYRTQVK